MDRFYANLKRNGRVAIFEAGGKGIGALGGERFNKGCFRGKIALAPALPRIARGGQVLIRLHGETEFVLFFLCDANSGKDAYLQLESALLTSRARRSSP